MSNVFTKPELAHGCARPDQRVREARLVLVPPPEAAGLRLTRAEAKRMKRMLMKKRRAKG